MALKLAVVGAGIMGANHVRIGAQLRDVEITHVVDADPTRAATLAQTVGAVASTSLADLDGVDAAVVAVPTELHVDTALALVGAGIHVLVEKPIAPSVAEGERLIRAADQAGVTLAVGHVERFNPAVLELDTIVAQPVHITATRLSPYSPRVTVGVVMDLMIHDLDIVRRLAGAEVTRVESVASVVHGPTEDLAAVLLGFANGVSANLVASRVAQQKIRELQITQADNFVTVDLLRQSVTINRVAHSEYLSADGARYRQTGVIEIPFLEHRGEPLALELGEFVHAVTRREPPRVTGRDGVEAVRLAEWVLERAGVPDVDRGSETEPTAGFASRS